MDKIHKSLITLKTYLRLSRLHRPVGIWLLLFPAWWGLALASSSSPSLTLLLLFGCGAILMRSAGCVYNDIIDKDLDSKVRRTARRPLASGELSIREAYGFLFLLLISSALILFSLPQRVILIGFIALGLVLIYPWMKRITYWPQLFLGMTFNIGVLMGWLSIESHLSFVPLLFYSGAIFWTIGYDTIYAFQDREDDHLVGIKSTALLVSSYPKLFIGSLYAVTLAFWFLGGREAHLSWPFWFLYALIGIHFMWQVLSLRVDDSENCLNRFSSNINSGLLLFLGIVFSRFID